MNVTTKSKDTDKKPKSCNVFLIVLVVIILGVVIFYAYSHVKSHTKKVTTQPKRVRLLLRNYNPEAGFFWVIYNVMCANFTAERHGFELVVLLDSGLYLETNPEFLREHSEVLTGVEDNWFRYYFESMWKAHSDTTLKPTGGVVSFSRYNTMPAKERDNVEWWEFDRDAYNTRDMFGLNFSQQWAKTCVLRPHIRAEFNSFCKDQVLPFAANEVGYANKVQPQQQQQIMYVGMHYRGSDKFGDAQSTEDDPEHCPYAFVVKLFNDWRNRSRAVSNCLSVVLIVCSDETAFVDFVSDAMRGDPMVRVVYTDAVRSAVCTSGLTLDRLRCGTMKIAIPGIHHQDDVLYRDLAKQSVHRGHKHVSSYVKGKQALIDVLLLSRCDVFFRSRGNFSNAPAFIRPSMEVIDVADEYRKAGRPP